jgi:hypothetical protein
MKYTLLFVVLINYSTIYSQCYNTTAHTTTEIEASVYSNIITTISTSIKPGQYCTITGLKTNKTYRVSSSGPADYITQRTVGGLSTDAALGHGLAPYTFTATTHNTELHINLTNTPCGTNNVSRTLTIECLSCASEPPKVGIGVTQPRTTLDVNGAIILDKAKHTPQTGMIQFNPASKDFEGYNGTKWVSLTKSSSKWGQPVSTTVNENEKITIDTGFTAIGTSVAISGNYAIISSTPNINDDDGEAFIYEKKGANWERIQNLKPTPKNDYYLEFGSVVAIDGDYAVVGVPSDSITAWDQGSVYVYQRVDSIWVQQTKLTATDKTQGDLFGSSVAIHGRFIIVGAPRDDIGANSNQGSAYIFVRNGNTWSQQQKIVSTDGAFNDYFGASVAIYNDHAVIGADHANITNSDQGAAYVFTRNNASWTQQTKLIVPNLLQQTYFGNAVAIQDTTIVIGAYSGVTTEFLPGSVYIFTGSQATWLQRQKLDADDATNGAEFGRSLSLHDNNLVIGAPQKNNVGASYLFTYKNNSWKQEAKFLSSNTATFYFGYRVSVHEGTIMVCAPAELNAGKYGAVYLFNANQ